MCRSSKKRKGKGRPEVKEEVANLPLAAEQPTVAETPVVEDTAERSEPPPPPVENGDVVSDSVPAASGGVAYKPPLPPGRRRPPVSATWAASRPLDQLDAALKQFRRDTAESRENLTRSRPDLAVIAAEVQRSYPGARLYRSSGH